MKKKLSIFALTLAFLLSLVSPAFAVSDPATIDPVAVGKSASQLYLSESELTFSAGDLIELQVLPTELAKPLGWEVSEINFSEDGILTVLADDDLEVIAYREEQAFATETTTPEHYADTHTNPADLVEEGLSIFLKANRSGTCKIEVSLENPLYDGPVELTIIAQSLDQQVTDFVNRTSQVLTRPIAPHPNLPTPPLKPDTPTEEPPVSDPTPPVEIDPPTTNPIEPPDDSQEVPGEDTEAPPAEPDNPDDNKPEDKPSRPGGSSPSRPSRPSTPTPPDGPDTPDTPDPDPGPDEPDNPDNPDPNPNPDPEPEPDPDPEPDEPLVFDTSEWKFDEATLSVVYDGEEHQPVLNGVPEEVTMTATGAATDAGTYEYTVSFEVPEGYEPVADMTVEYEITPATITVSQQYDFATGKVKPALTGLVDADIQVSTQVNGKDTDAFDASTTGSHMASTTVTIDGDKQHNYVLDSDLTTTTVYNVKSNTPWCDVELESSEENGQIVVKIKLNNLKIEQVQKSNSKVTLGMKVHHDTSKLRYSSDAAGYWGNGFAMSDYYWVLGTYEAYPGRPLPADTLVLALYYDLIDPEDKQDLLFSIDHIELVPNIVGADDVMNFKYTVGDVSFVVNPSKLNTEDIFIDRNPIEDTTYRGKDDDTVTKDDHYDRLEQYIKDNFDLPESDDSEDSGDSGNNSDGNGADVNLDDANQPANPDVDDSNDQNNPGTTDQPSVDNPGDSAQPDDTNTPNDTTPDNADDPAQDNPSQSSPIIQDDVLDQSNSNAAGGEANNGFNHDTNGNTGNLTNSGNSIDDANKSDSDVA